MKKTKTREEILNLFNNSIVPLTANDIYQQLKDKDITLSTIYRSLDTFTSSGMLIKGTDANNVAIYTLKKEHHAHYLECKNCHAKVELEYCPYHKVNDKISKDFDFQVDEQNVVIYGTCRDCNQEK